MKSEQTQTYTITTSSSVVRWIVIWCCCWKIEINTESTSFFTLSPFYKVSLYSNWMTSIHMKMRDMESVRKKTYYLEVVLSNEGPQWVHIYEMMYGIFFKTDTITCNSWTKKNLIRILRFYQGFILGSSCRWATL